MAPDRLPKGRFPGGIDIPPHLGDDRGREAGGEGADEEKSRQGKQAAIAAVAAIGAEKKRADFRRPAMLFPQVENHDLVFDVQRAVHKPLPADLVAVPGIETSDPPGDAARPDNVSVGQILQDKQVILGSGFAHPRAEGAQGILDPIGQKSLVGGKGGEAAPG